MRLAVAAFALTLLHDFGNGSKILGIFPIQSRSHYSVFEPLLKKLCDNGHELTVITPFPQRTKVENFTDIDISMQLSIRSGATPATNRKDVSAWGNAYLFIRGMGHDNCDSILNHPEVATLIKSDEHFDLVISESFATDCYLGFIHKFRAPWVAFIPGVNLPWLDHSITSMDNPSYVGNFFSAHSDRMTFIERVVNTVQLLGLRIIHRIYSDWPSYEVAKKHFGPDLPDFDQLRSKRALLLTNGHITVSTPRLLAPGVKEVGGIHIPATGPEPLPEKLKAYLDNVKHGVIYFSLGSLVNTSSLPPETMRILIDTFSKLAPIQILWKCNADVMPDLPSNVKSIAWAPQLSILCHPNVRVFMSHGGILSTQEAVYCGVPILGLPLYGDQFMNMAHEIKQGLALSRNIFYMTELELRSSLTELLTDPSYSKRAQEASKKFRDRLIHPLDEASFWVEYILRHGPDALKTAATDLTWYQYLLLDVIATIVLIAYLIYYVLRKFLCLVCNFIQRQLADKRRMKSE